MECNQAPVNLESFPMEGPGVGAWKEEFIFVWRFFFQTLSRGDSKYVFIEVVFFSPLEHGRVIT